jgi:hypothetical protein
MHSSEHSDAESVHADEEPEKMPKWAQSTLQDAGDLVGDPTDPRRTRSQFEDPPHVLTTTEPMMPLHCYMVQSSDPQTYREAAGNPFWEATMQEEYNSLLENQTWDLVPLPSDMNLVRCRWVYRTKKEVDGQVRRHKERLVSKGFQQIHKIDYDETFSPVEKLDSIRLALSIGEARGWEVHQMDMKNDFLHGDLSEDIYMEQTTWIHT